MNNVEKIAKVCTDLEKSYVQTGHIYTLKDSPFQELKDILRDMEIRIQVLEKIEKDKTA